MSGARHYRKRKAQRRRRSPLSNPKERRVRLWGLEARWNERKQYWEVFGDR